MTEAIEQRVILDLMGNLEGFYILDVGCGDGALTCAIASRGAVATGVDPDPAMLAAARARAGKDGIKAAFLDGVSSDFLFLMPASMLSPR